jgi:hypothetical protein
MLTAAQREKCRAIARGLDAGDAAAYTHAEASLTPEMKGEIWSLRRCVAAVGQHSGRGDNVTSSPQGKAATRPAHIETNLGLHDLDYWGDVEPVDDPDDDGDLEICKACDGSGRDSAGNRCLVCGGSGKAPADDEDDSNEE